MMCLEVQNVLLNRMLGVYVVLKLSYTVWGAYLFVF